MKAKITPTSLQGTVPAISAKSYAHRALICAALAKGAESNITITDLSRDIEATMGCLIAMGAKITKQTESVYRVTPIQRMDYRNQGAPLILDCGESGSTLRFLVPVCAALGMQVQFIGQGRLMERPMEEMKKQHPRRGCCFCLISLTKRCRGREYRRG